MSRQVAEEAVVGFIRAVEAASGYHGVRTRFASVNVDGRKLTLAEVIAAVAPRMDAEALLDAMVREGKLIRSLTKENAAGKRYRQYVIPDGSNGRPNGKPSREAILSALGITSE